MTNRQNLLAAVHATGASYFVVKFSEDQCISVIPSKMIVEPATGALATGDSCVVRWTDGCRYETKVLEIAHDYATAKRYERQHLEEQSPAPPPPKKAKLAKQGTASTAVKGKSKQPSKTKRKGNNLPPTPPKPRKENDKFLMEVGSQPHVKLVPPADNESSQPSSKQAASSSEQSANQEPSQQSSKQAASPSEQPANGEPSQQSLKRAANPSEQPKDKEPSQQSSKQQPLQIPEGSEKWFLEPHTLDLTTGPEETVDDSISCSSDGSDVIVHSESNVMTIDVDLSTKESVMNVGMQTDVVPCCRCEEAIAAIARLTHSVQTLSSRVDTSFGKLAGQLNLALDAIFSYHSQASTFTPVCPAIAPPSNLQALSPTSCHLPVTLPPPRQLNLTDPTVTLSTPPGPSRPAAQLPTPPGPTATPSAPPRSAAQLPPPPGPSLADQHPEPFQSPSTSRPASASEIIQHELSMEDLVLIKNESCSRRNFAMHQAVKLFAKREWMGSNCEGRKGKKKVRIEKIQAATFKLWPLEGKEKLEDAWKECKKAIDEGGRQFKMKKKHQDKTNLL